MRTAEVALAETRVDESPLVDELVQLGAHRDEVEALWVAAEAVSGAEHRRLTEESFTKLRALAREHEPPSGSSRVHLARKVDTRLDNLDQSLAELRRADQGLGVVSSRLAPRVAIGLGLGP